MKLLNLVQGSQEWLQTRLEHFTASEAPAMMDESKYTSRNQLLDHKKGWITTVDEHTLRIFEQGHETEEAMRPIIGFDEMLELAPVVGVKEVDGLPLLASLDGYNQESDFVWEHKLWNKTLAENVVNNLLEPHYYWQLEHQALVSDAKTIRFTVSDGKDQQASLYYVSQPERQQRLIAGWKQFQKDLLTHELKAKETKVESNKELTEFPSIDCSVQGNLITHNLDQLYVEVKTAIEQETSVIPQTDQDFANREAFIKQLKTSRAALKEKATSVKGEFVSVTEFEQAVANLDSLLQKTISQGEKEVKQNKEAKKQKIMKNGQDALVDHLRDLNQNTVPVILQLPATDFAAAIKGKRSFQSMIDAVDGLVSQTKVELNTQADHVCKSLDMFAQHKELSFLFKDIANLVFKDHEALQIIINGRVLEHRERVKQQEQELKAQQEAQLLSEADKLNQESSEQMAEVAGEQQTGFTTGSEVSRLMESFVEPEKEQPLETIIQAWARNAGINVSNQHVQILANSIDTYYRDLAA